MMAIADMGEELSAARDVLKKLAATKSPDGEFSFGFFNLQCVTKGRYLCSFYIFCSASDVF